MVKTAKIVGGLFGVSVALLLTPGCGSDPGNSGSDEAAQDENVSQGSEAATACTSTGYCRKSGSRCCSGLSYADTSCATGRRCEGAQPPHICGGPGAGCSQDSDCCSGMHCKLSYGFLYCG
jgi:hypothetical protein